MKSMWIALSLSFALLLFNFNTGDAIVNNAQPQGSGCVVEIQIDKGKVWECIICGGEVHKKEKQSRLCENQDSEIDLGTIITVISPPAPPGIPFTPNGACLVTKRKLNCADKKIKEDKQVHPCYIRGTEIRRGSACRDGYRVEYEYIYTFTNSIYGGASGKVLVSAKEISKVLDPTCSSCIIVTDESAKIIPGQKVCRCVGKYVPTCQKTCEGGEVIYTLASCNANGDAVCPPIACPTPTPRVTPTPNLITCPCGMEPAPDYATCIHKIRQAGLCVPGEIITCPNNKVVSCNAQCTSECKGDGDPFIPPCPKNYPTDCTTSGNMIDCKWGDKVRITQYVSCPEVSREPFPKGLAGVPNEFRIACQGGQATQQETFSSISSPPPGPGVCPPGENGEDKPWVIRMAIDLSWYCRPDSTLWYMGDNAVNIGFKSSNLQTPYVGDGIPDRPWPNPLVGRQIAEIMNETEGGTDVRQERDGRVIRHIYEQASIGQPRNGPNAYPASSAPHDAPSYQVQVTTSWGYRAVFKYTHKQKTELCVKPGCGGNPPRCYELCPSNMTCDPNRTDVPRCDIAVINNESGWIVTEVKEGVFSVNGANVKEDDADDNRCAPIPVPIQQFQTLLRPKR
ncbi:MAG: hypothetical protein NZM04_05580 [Methylacidiphilales bacterium]|nr:hypothetical protein [Candidatus Methylacidiphilales bacterium]